MFENEEGTSGGRKILRRSSDFLGEIGPKKWRKGCQEQFENIVGIFREYLSIVDQDEEEDVSGKNSLRILWEYMLEIFRV